MAWRELEERFLELDGVIAVPDFSARVRGF
jgi:hypothetical protein